MKKISLNHKILAASLLALSIGQAHALCDETESLLDRACKHVTDTWNKGDNSIYLPFHAYHLRSAYTAEKLSPLEKVLMVLATVALITTKTIIQMNCMPWAF